MCKKVTTEILKFDTSTPLNSRKRVTSHVHNPKTNWYHSIVFHKHMDIFISEKSTFVYFLFQLLFIPAVIDSILLSPLMTENPRFIFSNKHQLPSLPSFFLIPKGNSIHQYLTKKLELEMYLRLELSDTSSPPVIFLYNVTT